MTWFGDFHRDCATYEGSPLKHQGVWALFQYRVAHAVYERNPHSQWLLLLYAWRKVIEMTTGMSLPHQARLGQGSVSRPLRSDCDRRPRDAGVRLPPRPRSHLR